MKNTTINIRFDAAKLNALRFYTRDNDRSVEKELAQHLDELYEKNVPQNVKDYIKYQSGTQSEPTDNNETNEENTATNKSRRQKNSAQKIESVEETPAPVQSM